MTRHLDTVGRRPRARTSWARLGGLVAALFSVLSFPIGTALGLFTMFVLVDPEVSTELGST